MSDPLIGITILLIHDHEVLCSHIERFLAAKGAIVRTCSTAADVIRHVLKERPDLILIDLAVPRIDLELFKQIRDVEVGSGKNTPVIAIGNVRNPIEHLAAVIEGCSAYLKTPFFPDQLLSAVQSALRS